MAGQMDRVILHCDANNFFASVESLARPELKTVPMAVSNSDDRRHGVILAKNDLAKPFGVKTGESVLEALKKCPGLTLVKPHRAQYGEYSRKLNALYQRYTDRVEAASIDESFLDVTDCQALFGSGEEIANALRKSAREELGLTISVGVSFNKTFAKLGSDYKKPDATTVISRENWQDIVWPLPVGDLLFVGRAAGRVLHQYGVETIGQLAACSPQMLETLLGKLGLQLHEYANGLDGSPVRPAGQQEPVKSVGNGTTFPKNLTRWEEVQRGLAVLSDSVAMRLRQQGLYCGGVSVSLRNAQFRTVSRQMRLPAPTHLMKDIWQAAMELTRRLWKAPEPVRMLTVTALYITDSADSFQQLDLLEAPVVTQQQEKQEKLERTMDAIRGKYGRASISFGLPGEERAGWDD